MTTKVIKITIYLLFVVFLTYIVAIFSEASKIVDFLSDQQEIVKDDNLAYVATTVIANNQGNFDVYIKEEPLYHEVFDVANTNQHVEVSIYALVEFREKEAHNSLMIFLTDVALNNDDAYINSDDYHELKANIIFDRPITINEYTASSFDETFITGYDDTTKLILLNTDLFTSSAGVAQIEEINITYTLTSGSNVDFVSLSNSDLVTIVANDTFSFEYDRDLKNVTPANMDILSVYGTDQFENSTDIYYQSEWISKINAYNRYYFIYAGYELLILAPMTYFLFIHRYVLIKLREKNEQKALEYKARQESLKDKFRNE